MKWLRDKKGGLGKALWDKLMKIIAKFAPITPETGVLLAPICLLQATAAGAGAHGLAVAAEHTHPLKRVGYSYLAGIVSELAGYSRIAAATFGVLCTLALARPMTYFLQRKLRPWLPHPDDAKELASRGLITPERYREFLEYQGTPDDWNTLLLELRHTPLSAFLIPRIAAIGFADPAWIKAEAERRGYHPDTVRAIIAWAQAEAMGEGRAMFYGPIIAAFAEGLLTESQLRRELKSLWLRPAQIDMAVRAAKIRYYLDEMRDKISCVRDAVRRGVMAPEEMKEYLIAEGLRPERAEILASREAIRLMGRRSSS